MKPSFVVAGLFLASCLAFNGTGMAQTTSDSPASKEDVEKYLNAVHSHEMMKQMVDAMTKPMHQMAHEQCAKYKDTAPADCEATMNKNMDEMMKEMPFDEMMDAMIPAYEKHFTKGEMDALTAFYSAPTGQKILREMPAIMSESMETMMPLLKRTIDHMTERAQQQVAQIVKGPKTATSPNDPPAKN